MKILGIDPGKQGAYCILNDKREIIEKGGLPLIGKEYDVNEIYKIISSCDYVCVEDPGMIFGASKSAVASLRNCVGLLQGIAVGCQKPYSLIQPKEWQGLLWKNIPKQYKTSSSKEEGGKPKKVVDTKATSTLAVTRLYPTEDFKLTNKGGVSKNYNDGMVDACLLACYYFEQKNI